jgi:hypothetical protein
MTQEFDAGTRAVLDSFTVPAPRAGLVDAIVAAALSNPATPNLANTAWPRSAARSAWARRTMIGSVMLLSAVSAAAAAAGGWFGERAVQLPVISAIATVIPEIVKAKPKAKTETRVAAKAIPTPVPPPTVSAPVAKPVANPAPTPAAEAFASPEVAEKSAQQALRKERFAAKLTERLDMRDVRRAQRGLAPNTERERALLEQFRAAQSDEEKKAARTSLRQLREERRSRFRQRTGQAVLGTPTDGAPADAQQTDIRRGDRLRAYAQRPICTDQQASAPQQNGCRLPRRKCADIPKGAWLPPRCRAEVSPSDEER